ncbi:MAG: GAF domain-containing protein [Bacteroidota bacterium]
MKLFDRKRIKHQIRLAFYSILAISAITTAFSIHIISKIRSNDAIIQKFDRILLEFSNIRSAQQSFQLYDTKSSDFYSSEESKYLTKSLELYKILQSSIQEFEQEGSLDDPKVLKLLEATEKQMEAYVSDFKDLVQANLDRGFKDWGAVGKMRASIHAVEESSMVFDQQYMLMLRRHEKDFLLRKDDKYLKKFEESMEDFYLYLGRIQDSTNVNKIGNLKSLLMEYEDSFRQVVKLDLLIGFSENEGMLENLNRNYSKLESSILNLNQLINDDVQSTVRQNLSLVFILFSIQIIICLVVVYFFSKNLAGRIVELSNFIEVLSKGSYKKLFNVKGKDEISEAEGHLNKLLKRIQSASRFAADVGNGNFNAKYEDDYRSGELSQELMKMQGNLLRMKNENDLRQKHLSMLSEITESIRKKYNSEEDFSRAVISHLVNLMDASLGALYILKMDNEEPYLKLAGCYAFKRQKFIGDVKILPGQGLVGQSYWEKAPIYLTEIPEDYIYIRSALGESSPKSLLVVPTEVDGEIVGIIELASFSEFSEKEIELVQKVGENIASVIKYTANYSEDQKSPLDLEEEKFINR